MDCFVTLCELSGEINCGQLPQHSQPYSVSISSLQNGISDICSDPLSLEVRCYKTLVLYR